MESRRETCGSVHRTKRDREDGDETAESMADENGGESRWDEEKGIEEGRRRRRDDGDFTGMEVAAAPFRRYRKQEERAV